VIRRLKSARGMFIVFGLINFAMLFQTEDHWPFLILNMFSKEPSTSEVYRFAFINPDKTFSFAEKGKGWTWYLNIYYSKISSEIYPKIGLDIFLKKLCKEERETCVGQEVGLVKRHFIGSPARSDFSTHDEIVYSKIL